MANRQLKTTHLGELIRRERKAKNLTLRQLGEISGVDFSLIARIERDDQKSAYFSTVIRICDALGIDISRAADLERERNG